MNNTQIELINAMMKSNHLEPHEIKQLKELVRVITHNLKIYNKLNK